MYLVLPPNAHLVEHGLESVVEGGHEALWSYRVLWEPGNPGGVLERRLIRNIIGLVLTLRLNSFFYMEQKTFLTGNVISKKTESGGETGM